MTERTTLYFAVLALGAACARGPAAALAGAPTPTAGPPETGVFEVSSLDSHYAIRGHVIGHVELRPDSVVVYADQSALRTSDAPAPGRADTLYHALAVSVGLARADGDSWRVAARSPRQGVTDAVVRGVEYHLPPRRLAAFPQRRRDSARAPDALDPGARGRAPGRIRPVPTARHAPRRDRALGRVVGGRRGP